MQTIRHPLTNGGLDLSSVEALPEHVRGQRVVILITLVAALPRINVHDFREPLGWTPDEMQLAMNDFGSIVSQLDLAH